MCQYKSCFNDFCRYNSIIFGEIKLNEVAMASCVHKNLLFKDIIGLLLGKLSPINVAVADTARRSALAHIYEK